MTDKAGPPVKVSPADAFGRPPATLGLAARHVNVLIYGQPGVGKTYFGGTGPKPVYVMDCDTGSLSLSRMQGVYSQKVRTFQEIMNQIKYLEDCLAADPTYYRTIVVDNLTEMQRILLNNITANKQAQVQDWGRILNDMQIIVRGIRNLPVHTVFIAQEKNRDMRLFPSLSGQMAEEIPAFFDLVGHYTMQTVPVETKGQTDLGVTFETIRAIRFYPTPTIMAKDRSGVLEEFEHPDLRAIVKKIKEAARAAANAPEPTELATPVPTQDTAATSS